MPSFTFEHPDQAIEAWLSDTQAVSAETVEYTQAAGRILAEDLIADRDSPACDVSAMDGIALAYAELQDNLPLYKEITAGLPPFTLPKGYAARCFTGAAIPHHADTVIRREDLSFSMDESKENVQITCPLEGISAGQNVRRRGENLKQGETIISAGTIITPPVMGAIATVGATHLSVRKLVRTSILTTGNELLNIHSKPEAWQIRDSNGPSLFSHFKNDPRVVLSFPESVSDDLDATTQAIIQRLEKSNLLILTGGVSMGDHDYVPQALSQAGCKTVFHKLPIRPGKPVLAAIGPQGQLILALPGNPVSALIGASLFAEAAIRQCCGQTLDEPIAFVTLNHPPAKKIALWHYLPVILSKDSIATIVPSKGSGDIMACAQSTGFVRIPPDQNHTGPFPYYPWNS